MERLRQIGWITLAICTLLIAGKVIVNLLRVLHLEAAGAVHGDAGTYLYLGRALLNGLKPYVDLFDAKPPGIYLIMAASLWLTHSEMFASWLQIFSFALFPLLCMLFAYVVCNGKVRELRTWVLIGLGCIAGTLFSLYSEERSGMLQPEGFAFILSMLYAFLLAYTGLQSLWSIAVAGLCLAGSIGLKEPFLFTNVAIALLLTPSWKELPRTLLLPLMIGGVLSVLLLAILGLFGPYFLVHLPNMLIHRIQETVEYNPVWLRPLRVLLLYGNMVSYYPTGRFTGWLIIALWISAPLLLHRKEWEWPSVLEVALFMFGGMVAMNSLYVILLLKGGYPGAPFWQALSQIFSWVDYALPCLGLVGLILLLWRRERSLLRSGLFVLCILYITAFAVGAGVAYHPNFFVFAVPVYGTLLLLWIRAMAERTALLYVSAPLITLVLLAGLLYRPDPQHLRALALSQSENYAHNGEKAERLDTLLDSCGFDRAVTAVGNSGYHFARHTPWGPLIGLTIPAYFPPDHPYGSQTVHNITDRTQIIIYEDEEFLNRALVTPVLPLIRERFTETPPDCAKPHLPLYDYKVLFRKPGGAGG